MSGSGCRRRFVAAWAAFVGCIAANRVASHAGGCSFVFAGPGTGSFASPCTGTESIVVWGVGVVLGLGLCSTVLIVLQMWEASCTLACAASSSIPWALHKFWRELCISSAPAPSWCNCAICTASPTAEVSAGAIVSEEAIGLL